MSDLISRQAAIDAICEHGTNLERRGITVLSVANHKQVTVDLLETLPSAQPEQKIEELLPDGEPKQECPEFISWLLDEVWDDEMWELNYRVFPELVCRRLVRTGWLKEEGGKYVRRDK